jgi:hypothetical protein
MIYWKKSLNTDLWGYCSENKQGYETAEKEDECSGKFLGCGGCFWSPSSHPRAEPAKQGNAA